MKYICDNNFFAKWANQTNKFYISISTVYSQVISTHKILALGLKFGYLIRYMYFIKIFFMSFKKNYAEKKKCMPF